MVEAGEMLIAPAFGHLERKESLGKLDEDVRCYYTLILRTPRTGLHMSKADEFNKA